MKSGTVLTVSDRRTRIAPKLRNLRFRAAPNGANTQVNASLNQSLYSKNRRPKRRLNYRRLVQKVEQMPWPDLKELTSGQVAVPASTTMSLTCINLVPQGNTEITRIGNDITVRKILIRGVMASTGSPDLSNANLFRVIVFYSPSRIGAPTATSILHSAVVESPRNLATAKDYRFLYDKVHTVSSQDPVNSFIISIKGKFPVRYNDAVPLDQSDFDWGAMYVFVLSQASDADQNLYFISRIRYTDS